ncbi:hypothetical protein BDW02DRAFT_223305 [Decorospora gaudefroyi]|uniref:Zn(2)-C6 fungal-type domain-containing protein n=1 Tax=Decorospora gaudefroyi TaxID=184978 RepID=A0A6A5K283_9PLEO|nr:hypothetical protein BDW02DRAFT_223305 [Decorospora gaudefroyi]
MDSIPCLLCRSRKVKCDRSNPECENCVRLGVTCPGYKRQHDGLSSADMRLTAEAIYKASGLEKRHVGSCDACRASKIRCTKTRPTCRRCLTRNIECTYNIKEASPEMQSSSRRSRQAPPPPTGDGLKPEDALLLKDPVLLSRLLTAYFDRVHPLRCLAFVHKPSFLYSLDRGNLMKEYDESLVDAMCALGARHLSRDSSGDQSESLSLTAQALSDRARTKVMSQLHNPTAQQLMTTILLCEYASRTDRHAMAFVLVGCIFRQLCLLGLDTSADGADSSQVPVERDIESRLAWACYCLDALFASGVDKNSSWRENYPRMSLPCSDSEFLSQTASRTPTLAQALKEPSLIRALDLPALNVVLIHLRTKVLRCIRTAYVEGNIWEPSSSFMVILQQLETFYNNLPAKYGLAELNMYMLKDQHILGAVFFLHLLYHAALCDLTRISLPGFCFPLAAGMRNATAAFISQCQRRCQFHAESISDLIRKGRPHGRMAFDDPFIADATFESTKIQIVISAIMPNNTNDIRTTRENVITNFELMNMLNLDEVGSSPYINALLSLCTAFGFHDIAREWQNQEIYHNEVPAEVVGSAEVHHLSNMAPFRRARTETRAQQSNASPRTVTSESSEGSHMRLDHGNPPTISANFNPDEAQLMSLSPLASLDFSGNPLPQHDGMAHTGGMQPPMPDYTRTAEEMSQYLTWDAAEWWSFGSQNMM